MVIMKKFLSNLDGSAVPVILFVLAIIVCGALYTLFFVEIGIPEFDSYTSSGDPKTFIMMCIYAIPGIILVVGVICLVKTGLKREVSF
jgi:hypothetical protein